MGQALLPEHFYAQEQSLREEVSIRTQLSGPPNYGVGVLRWDSFQLPKGILSVQELSVLFPSGTLIDIPGNAGPAFLNLNASGSTKPTVYLHMLSDFDTIAVGEPGMVEGGVERIVQRVELSTNPFIDGSVENIRLAELECSAEGSWSVRAEFLPAHLRVGDTPFFVPYIERTDAIIRTLRQVLLSEIAENHLATESQAAAKQCLRDLFRFQAFIVDLKGEVRPHPYELFSRIRDLYTAVCIYRGVSPSEIEKPYAHEELAPLLMTLFEKMEEQVTLNKERIPYVEFGRREGLWVCDLPREARRAKDLFLLVQKAQISGKVDLGRVKLASLARIHTVHEKSLRGIPFQSLERPPFHHGLASSVEFFSLTPGQEWDYCVREGSLALFDSPVLQGTRLYLYWRGD